VVYTRHQRRGGIHKREGGYCGIAEEDRPRQSKTKAREQSGATQIPKDVVGGNRRSFWLWGSARERRKVCSAVGVSVRSRICNIFIVYSDPPQALEG